MGAETVKPITGETDESHLYLQVKQGQNSVLACTGLWCLLVCSLDCFFLLSRSTFPNCLIVSWGGYEPSQEIIWMRPLGFEGNECLAL